MGGPVKRFFSSPKIQQVVKPPAPKPEPIRMTATDPRYDKSKRRGRRSTILTSTEGAEEQANIQLKTLLGG